MFTKLTFIIRTYDAERLMMTTFIQKSSQWHRLYTLFINILISIENFRINKYWSSLIYERLVEFLQKKVFALEELNQNWRWQIIWKSKKFILISILKISALKYKKNNESFSLCIIEFEVLRFLKATHENHDHYTAALTLNFLINRTYWLNRVKDVYNWCQICHACQMKAHRFIKVNVQLIQIFESMIMIKMN